MRALRVLLLALALPLALAPVAAAAEPDPRVDVLLPDCIGREFRLHDDYYCVGHHQTGRCTGLYQVIRGQESCTGAHGGP